MTQAQWKKVVQYLQQGSNAMAEAEIIAETAHDDDEIWDAVRIQGGYAADRIAELTKMIPRSHRLAR